MSNVSMRIDLWCCLCPSRETIDVPTPDGWAVNGVDDEDAFCPIHAPVVGFRRQCCPGCVESFGDCDMWRAFAHSKRTINDNDYATLEAGRCPRRSNGTYLTRSGPAGYMEVVDISEVSVEGGTAFAAAIREYVERNP